MCTIFRGFCMDQTKVPLPSVSTEGQHWYEYMDTTLTWAQVEQVKGDFLDAIGLNPQRIREKIVAQIMGNGRASSGKAPAPAVAPGVTNNKDYGMNPINSSSILLPSSQTLPHLQADIEVNYPDAEITFDSPFRPQDNYIMNPTWELLQTMQAQSKKDAEEILRLQVEIKQKDEFNALLQKDLNSLRQQNREFDDVYRNPHNYIPPEFEPISEPSEAGSEIEYPLHQQSTIDTPLTLQEEMEDSDLEKSNDASPQDSDAETTQEIPTENTQLPGDGNSEEETEKVEEVTQETDGESGADERNQSEIPTAEADPGKSTEEDIEAGEENEAGVAVTEADPEKVTQKTATITPVDDDNESSEDKDDPEVPPADDAEDTPSSVDNEETFLDPFTDPNLPTEPDHEKGIYVVEAVHGCMIANKKGQLWYLIRWKTFPLEESSWEPKKNCHTVLEALEVFYKENGRPTKAIPKILDADGRKYEEYHAKKDAEMAKENEKRKESKVSSKRVEAAELYGYKKPKVPQSQKKRKRSPPRSASRSPRKSGKKSRTK